MCPAVLTIPSPAPPPPAPRAAPRAAAAFTRARPAAARASVRAPLAARRVVAMASSMQFIKGIDEPTIPDVKLTRSRDGSSGTGALPGLPGCLLSGAALPGVQLAAQRRSCAVPCLLWVLCKMRLLCLGRLPCCCCRAHRCSLPASLPRPPSLPAAATFIFQNPAIFEASSELGDITGLYMTDDEGTIQVRP